VRLELLSYDYFQQKLPSKSTTAHFLKQNDVIDVTNNAKIMLLVTFFSFFVFPPFFSCFKATIPSSGVALLTRATSSKKTSGGAVTS
jgi:uncharacterized protein YbbC (DUF1343 family)